MDADTRAKIKAAVAILDEEASQFELDAAGEPTGRMLVRCIFEDAAGDLCVFVPELLAALGVAEKRLDELNYMHGLALGLAELANEERDEWAKIAGESAALAVDAFCKRPPKGIRVECGPTGEIVRVWREGEK